MNTRYSQLPLAATLNGTAITGAVTRKPRDRHADIINVKDFGAIGNGTTDDTAAIQLAINNGYANGAGIVFFPPGRYLITSTLLINPARYAHRLFRFVGCGSDLESETGSVLIAHMPSYILYSLHGTTGMVSMEGLGFVNTGASIPLSTEPKNSPDLYYVITGISGGSNGSVRLTNSAMDFAFTTHTFKTGDSADVSGVTGAAGADANGTWTLDSPNWDPASWFGIPNPSQTSASAGGSGGTNYRMNYYAGTGVKIGDVLTLSGINNVSDGSPSAINGDRTVTAIGPGAWNTGWIEFNFAFTQVGQGGSVRAKWVDLRGSTFNAGHAWSGGGEWHYNGFASGCVYAAAGIGIVIKNCSFKIDRGICLMGQAINMHVANCHFKGGFDANDVKDITSTSAGTATGTGTYFVRLAVSSTSGMVVGAKCQIWGVSPLSNEANSINGFAYAHTITAVGAGYVEIAAEFANSGSGGRIAMLGSIGMMTGCDHESCVFENLSIGMMGGFNGPGVMNVYDTVFRQCGYCLVVGHHFISWWEGNTWNVVTPGDSNFIAQIKDSHIQNCTMEDFSIGGCWFGAGVTNSIQSLKIQSSGVIGTPNFGLGGAGGSYSAYRNVTITGVYSGAALDLSRTQGSVFDNINVNNTGSGVAYTPSQGVNSFRNVRGFNPARLFFQLTTGGDWGPFVGQKVLISDCIDAAQSNIGKPVPFGGGGNHVEVRWDGTNWCISG